MIIIKNQHVLFKGNGEMLFLKLFSLFSPLLPLIKNFHMHTCNRGLFNDDGKDCGLDGRTVGQYGAVQGWREYLNILINENSTVDWLG